VKTHLRNIITTQGKNCKAWKILCNVAMWNVRECDGGNLGVVQNNFFKAGGRQKLINCFKKMQSSY
jgi:hypothetical protein